MLGFETPDSGRVLVEGRDVAFTIERVRDLIEANRQDQLVTRYRTYPELEQYCELSANPVGRVVLYVFGAFSPAAATR